MLSSSSQSGSCQDCGNKAKRDCEHLRCRTCCKNRGFVCPTHVKSTWVPVARRRQLLLHHHHRFSLHLHTPNPSSGLQGRNYYQTLPAEINTVANFRRVRLTSGDNAVDEVAAYQGSVIIAGHLFKGILYDQGPGSAFPGGGIEGSSADHQMAGMTSASTHLGDGVGGENPVPYYMSNPNSIPHHEYTFYSSNAPMLPPGMQFFPHPKP